MNRAVCFVRREEVESQLRRMQRRRRGGEAKTSTLSLLSGERYSGCDFSSSGCEEEKAGEDEEEATELENTGEHNLSL